MVMAGTRTKSIPAVHAWDRSRLRAFLVLCSFCGWTGRNTTFEYANSRKCLGKSHPMPDNDLFSTGLWWLHLDVNFAVTPALLHNPINWFSSCQNASTNESSVDDVVDLAVTRLTTASPFSARVQREARHDAHQMSLLCHSNDGGTTTILIGRYYYVAFCGNVCTHIKVCNVMCALTKCVM